MTNAEAIRHLERVTEVVARGFSDDRHTPKDMEAIKDWIAALDLAVHLIQANQEFDKRAAEIVHVLVSDRTKALVAFLDWLCGEGYYTECIRDTEEVVRKYLEVNRG